MIGSICNVPEVLKVMRIVQIVITIIRIAVPIMLLLSCSISFLKAVKEDDELDKVKKGIVSKVIAAILVFFIPTFVSLIANVVLGDSEYKNCLGDISLETIASAFSEQEETLVKKAEESEDMYDYSNAQVYLMNIDDEAKRKSFEDRLKIVKEKIDERNKKKNNPGIYTTGLGKDLPVTDQVKTACGYVLNDETVKVHLTTCTDQHQYKNPSESLPGGAVLVNGNYHAKEDIPFSKYRMGVFFGEIYPSYSTEEFSKMFAIMYTNVIMRSLVPRQIRRGEANKVLPVLNYVAGSCTQNYREEQYRNEYESGKDKEYIDRIMASTKYFILVNDDGELTDVRYNTSSGILDVMKKAANQGKDYLGILEAMRSGHDQAWYYKKAHVYDCRNLLEGTSEDRTTEDVSEEEVKNLNANIIHLGDSRIEAYKNIKSYLGFNDNTETIYARHSTGYDEYFKSHMNSAKSLLNSNKNKTYDITVNYGVNAKSSYKSFCDYYDNFIKEMDKKHSFYIVSVNPFDEKNVAYYKDSNTNANIEKFNNYMKDTCINQIKNNNPNAKVYYCDVYGSIPLSKWVSNNYISSDGIHYTKEGYKYIYEYTKKCIASHK